MPIVIVDGERRYLPTYFVSQAVYNACYQGQPWDPEQYLFVEIDDLLPAYITAEESVRMAELSAADEFVAFADEIGLRPMPGEEFDAWQRGERPHPPTE